jgi:uncharacterized SAM-binding protein YcdF (DUF218 family)
VVPRRSLKLPIAVGLLILALALAATHTAWMTALGKHLVREDGPAKADLAVVLAGDKYGNRILKAAELVRQGYVPTVLVSGPAWYGTYESDIAIAFAVRHGYPAGWFVSVPHSAESTGDEAWQILRALESRRTNSFLLVTSDYHTARAGRIFRRALRKSGSRMQMRVVAAPDRWFQPESWWRTREGRKTFALEWSKTLSSAFGK